MLIHESIDVCYHRKHHLPFQLLIQLDFNISIEFRLEKSDRVPQGLTVCQKLLFESFD